MDKNMQNDSVAKEAAHIRKDLRRLMYVLLAVVLLFVLMYFLESRVGIIERFSGLFKLGS